MITALVRGKNYWRDLMRIDLIYNMTVAEAKD